MRASEACIAHLMAFEQFRPTAYKPTPVDVWTLGYGHTTDVKEGDTCTIHQAIVWLHGDVRRAEDAVNHGVTPLLSQNEFDALVSFVFNIGTGAFLESTCLRKLNDGDYGGASDEMLRWTKQKGRVLAGLVTRRAAERDMFNGTALNASVA